MTRLNKFDKKSCCDQDRIGWKFQLNDLYEKISKMKEFLKDFIDRVLDVVVLS